MPNWCYNNVTIEGPEEEISFIKAKLNESFTMEHENYSMETKQMQFQTFKYSNPVFAFWNIIRPEDMITYRLQRDPNHGNTVIDFNGNNWYDWNVRNWGTKWDVAVSDDEKYPDTQLVTDTKDTLVYLFNTAWGPSTEAIQKLSTMIPNCNITLTFQEETGWGGEYEFENGEITASSDYESQCRDCDSIDCMEYCENDCGEICNVCHDLGEADLDVVAECDIHKIYLDNEHVPEYRRVIS